eukprot:2524686-Amphidinium_carterae.1
MKNDHTLRASGPQGAIAMLHAFKAFATFQLRDLAFKSGIPTDTIGSGSVTNPENHGEIIFCN